MNISEIIENIDTLFCNGEFDKVNEYIGRLEPGVHSVDEVITVLVSTLCAKEKLSNRSSLYNKALSYYTISSPEEVQRLLEGLE